ncbi:amino acid ABC transporter permease [Variovorax sp. LG9.2]|jgi:polar amino acid transport system permease protein|uniref:amino acid ABC transporter permease n=1 Tax=Variovorax sp. LG9.2 TaxID=3048626 RepID=UPI0019949415|nr:amino acid ABC transporter permease [Variovorax sp. LG9.2]MBC7391861.1 amino acid ABC transporter permease [Variovorax sp.]MEB0055516.1 amino acid ABC transporter permease [Variovorax sp. LG9.2]
MTREQATFLFMGMLGTLALSVLTFVGGGLAGLAVALARIAPMRGVRVAAIAWIQVVQGTPLLVLMGLCFYGPSIVGIGSMPALIAAALAMTIYSSAFLGEIWRGCIQSVHKSQWEAAECIGLTRWQRMQKIVLPQALRIATPPTVGFMVQIIKNTSIASLVIGFAELSYNAKVLNNSTFQPFIYFGCAALMYFAMCYPLSRWSRTLERKLNASRG